MRRGDDADPTGAVASEPFVRLTVLGARERATSAVGSPTSAPAPDPSRTTYEERTGALIRRALLPPGLDAEALGRVWARLGYDSRLSRRLLSASTTRWALATTVLMLSSAVVLAKSGVWTWPRTVLDSWSSGRPNPQAEAGRANRSQVPARGGLAAPARSGAVSLPTESGSAPGATVVTSAAPDVADVNANSNGKPLPHDQAAIPGASPPSVSPPGRAAADPSFGPASTGMRSRVARPRPGRTLARGAPAERPRVAPEPTPVPVDSTLAEESLILGRAFTLLRQQRDPAGALRELERYAARFPTGTLGGEAVRARVDALLMTGQLNEARAVLSGLVFGSGLRDRELRLIRAELLAATDCRQALADFDNVLGEIWSSPLAERALWGRAACRARLGDRAGARRDLADYLVRFPSGPHAATARARVEESSASDVRKAVPGT